MAPGLPRTHFNGSRLVRVLAELAVADFADAKHSIAERLGQWLDFTDALSLFSALNGGTAAGAGGRSAAPSPARAAVGKEFARVRGVLADSIATDGVLTPGRARVELPVPAAQAAVEGAADFAPYHRYYLAHQRDMNLSIGPLRATVRAALSGRSPSLKRLAALDAVLDQALAAQLMDENHKLTEPWRFAVLTGTAKARLAEIRADHRLRKADDPASAQARAEKARRETLESPAIIVVMARTSEDPITREEDYAAVMMATANLMTAAQSLGLGTYLKTGGVMRDPALAELIGLPDSYRVVGILSVGYPVEAEPPRRRRPAGELTSWLRLANASDAFCTIGPNFTSRSSLMISLATVDACSSAVGMVGISIGSDGCGST